MCWSKTIRTIWSSPWLALERSQLANDVVVLRDGAEAVDYLLRREPYADREPGNPAVMLLDLKLQGSMASRCWTWCVVPGACAASPWSC